MNSDDATATSPLGADSEPASITRCVADAVVDDELFRLQVRIARRADQLAQARRTPTPAGPGRRFWIMAEREVLGPSSRVALFDLLSFCARFSHADQR